MEEQRATSGEERLLPLRTESTGSPSASSNTRSPAAAHPPHAPSRSYVSTRKSERQRAPRAVVSFAKRVHTQVTGHAQA